jgi:PAS domain S-box-containing protein
VGRGVDSSARFDDGAGGAHAAISVPATSVPATSFPAASRLRELIDVDAIGHLLEDFYRLTGFGVAILDMRGEVLVATGWQRICAQFHRVHPETAAACAQSDLELSRGVPAGEFRRYRCGNGLWDMATPIVVGGDHVGNVFLGQFLLDEEEPDRDRFRARARRYGFDEEDYLAALDELPRWDLRQVETVMAVYSRLAQVVSELGQANLDLQESMQTASRLVESLDRGRREFATLAEDSPDLIVRFDTGLRHIYANAAAATRTGLTPEQCLGRRPSEIGLPADKAQFMEAALDRALRTGENQVVAQDFPTPAGMFYFETHVVPEFDGDGEVVSLLAVSRDTTQRRRALEEAERSESRALERARTLEIIAATVADPVAEQDGPAICRLMGEAVRRLLPEVKVLTSHVLPDGDRLQIVGAAGAEKHVDAVKRLLGRDPFAYPFAVSAIPKEDAALFVSGKLERLDQGLYTLAMHKLPRRVCRSLEKLLGAEEVWSVGLTWEGRHHGGVTILAPAAVDVEGRRDAIETLVHQGAIALQRAESRRELAASEAELRTTVDGLDEALHVVDTDLRIVMANSAFAMRLGELGLSGNYLGKDLREVCPFLPESALEEYARVALTRRALVTEEVNQVGGRTVYTETRRLPIVLDGETQQIITIVRDVSERRLSEEALRASERSLDQALEGTVGVMGALAEMRDPYTAGHEQLVTRLAMAIGERMGLPEQSRRALRLAGQVHDIGKIAVPAEILSKPGRLSDMEFQLVRRHPQVGYEILSGIEFRLPIADIVHQHHERVDGSGYPQGLTGEQMLPEARILAVADVIEAMASHRPYRPALGIEAALEEVERGRGSVYDPDVVDACLAMVRDDGFDVLG